MEQNFRNKEKDGALLHATDWKSQMQMVYAVATNAEQKVADFLLAQGEILEQMTLRDVASGAGVGQPTVVRVLKKAGFDGWNDFLHVVWKGKMTLDENSKSQLPAALACMQTDIAVIQEMAQHLKLKEMKKLATVIKNGQFRGSCIGIIREITAYGAAEQKLFRSVLPESQCRTPGGERCSNWFFYVRRNGSSCGCTACSKTEPGSDRSGDSRYYVYTDKVCGFCILYAYVCAE